jgi:NTE family protein
MAETKAKHRVAVVLSGGGGKGAYEVGVLKALKAFGVEPDIYCGTSVGSFTSGMLVSGKSLDEVERVWRELTTNNVFKLRYDPRRFFSLDPLIPMRFAFQSAKMVGRFVAEMLKSSGSWWETIDLDSFLIDTSPLAELIASNVNLEAVRKSAKKFFLAMTQLKPPRDNALQIVSNDKITHHHILASCSLPLIFPPVTIGDSEFCDGGVVMNSPLKPAIDAGADEIYVLDLTPPPRSYREGTLPLAYQVMSAQFASALQRDIQYAEDLNNQFLAAHLEGRLVGGKFEVKTMDPRPESVGKIISRHYRYVRLNVIRPTTDLAGIGGFLRFDPHTAAEWINAGERETKKLLERRYEHEVQGPDGSKIKAVLLR